MNKFEGKKHIIFKSFSGLFYVLSVICICAGLVGVKTIQSNSFESQKSVNSNIDKTVSSKDLMNSVQRITKKLEEEARLKRIAEEKAKEEKAAKEAANLGTTAPKSEIQQYAHDMAISKYGWTEADFTGLVKLWSRESGWNPKSYNKYTGACGIPQALPCSKIAKAYGSNTWQNQVKWGLRYINNKYGSGAKAWAFFQNNGWY